MTKITRSLRIVSATGAAVVVMLVSANNAFATVPTFAQTSYTVGVGQTASITSQNGVAVYMTTNSSPTTVSVTTNSAQITFTGIGLGNSSLTFCAVGTALDCANLTVVVQTGAVQSISLSQSSISLPVGNNQAITVSGGNGSYNISSNSNSAIASANLSGNTVTVSGLAVGSNTINICDTSNSCGSISITVTSMASGLSFSSNNLSLISGSSQVVTVSGGNGVYNVSSNSNSGVASASISSNVSNSIIVTASPSSTGSAAINVCDTANVCGTLSVTVAASSANQNVTFSVQNPTLTVGGKLDVTLSNNSGASGYFVLTNTTSSVAQATVNGSILSLSGMGAGTDLLVICAAGSGCSQLNVTVTGTGTASTPAATAVSPVITPAPTVTTTITQPGTVAVSSQILAQIQTIKASLAQALAQIQSAQSQLAQLEAQLNAGGVSSVGTGASLSSGTFTDLLSVGSQNSQVTALQNKLTALGFYSGPVTGYYGSLTREAVIKYQTARGITATGSLGPSTRASLNAGN